MNAHDKNLVIVRAVVEQDLSAAQAAVRFRVARRWAHTLLRRCETARTPS